MPDELRSPIKHHLVLHRIDPEEGIRRFYSLMIERDRSGPCAWYATGPDRDERAGEGKGVRQRR
jgi:hypothetical protein